MPHHCKLWLLSSLLMIQSLTLRLLLLKHTTFGLTLAQILSVISNLLFEASNSKAVILHYLGKTAKTAYSRK